MTVFWTWSWNRFRGWNNGALVLWW